MALATAGCAAHWHGPAPPVVTAPPAEPAPAAGSESLPTVRLWTYKHNTYFGAAPVAVGNALALVDHKGRVTFLDPNSGKAAARAKAKYPLEAAPVWDAERFYVVQAAPRHRLEAFGFSDGQSLWRRDFTRPLQPPIILSKELVVAAGDSVLALEPASGRTVRVIATSRGPWLGPVACDSGLLLADVEGRIRLVGRDGGSRWELDLAVRLQAPPAVAGGFALFAGMAGDLVCVDLDGREHWRDTLGSEPLYRPQIVADRAFVVGRDGAVTAVDLATGARLWQRTLSAPGAHGLQVHDGWVAANSVDGVLWLLDPAGGDVLDTLNFGELIHDPPAWAFGRLYVVTENKRLHALGEGH